MPESPEVDLSNLEAKAKEEISDFVGEEEVQVEEESVGFGLTALKTKFVFEEEKGDTEELENDIEDLEEVNSVEVVDVRRAIE